VGGDCPGATPIDVVAAEDFWGSIAAQLGGRYVRVTSIIDNPGADPHDYEPTAGDGRTVATARYVIANGLGYDPWITKLADANPDPDRAVLDIGQHLGLQAGDNPHRWYFPGDVDRVIDRISADLRRLVPAAAPCFDRFENEYRTQGLSRYHRLIDQIRQSHAGAPIGASESIAVGLAQATGLTLATPESLLDAITEGNDPTVDDLSTAKAQIAGHRIEAFVFNRQNAGGSVRDLVDQATQAGIPVVPITETPDPADATFQDWQADQLQALLTALDRQPRP
jgi:zinc/manganese transport system substrate-binding protein